MIFFLQIISILMPFLFLLLAPSIFLMVVIGVFSLLFLITLHEFAHFIMAKVTGAYVYEFSIGVGPKIFQWRKKETAYTLRLLPFGGYVSIASELVDPPKGREKEQVAEKQLMENLHRGKKALFISAGALMNLLLAFIFLIVSYSIVPYRQDLSLTPVVVNSSPVSEAISKYNQEHPNDVITKTDQMIAIENTNKVDSYQKIKDFYQLQNWLKKNIKVVDKKEPNVHITFADNKIINPKIKKQNNYFLGLTAGSKKLNAGQVIGYGFLDTFKASYTVLQAVGKMFTFQLESFSGPVGIIKTTSQFLDPSASLQQNFSTFFRWISLLSANLFLLNMLPIPPFDGYKFFENGIEIITRKKLNSKFKIIVSIVGSLLVLFLFIAIIIKDILFW